MSDSTEQKPLVVKSAVKDVAHLKGMRISEEALVYLTVLIDGLISTAAKRAQENNRQTIKPCDL